jgi:bacillithiol biosynthesis deacetylase BshB1
MKLDVLAFGAHPDDVELSCSGTILKLVNAGKKVGIVDLTQGEMGTRGTIETRKAESEASNKILGIAVRENLYMEDGFFEVSRENKLKVVQMLRKYQPTIVFANAVYDRHTDHGRAAELIDQSIFIAGLAKVETELNGIKQTRWRPKQVFNYIQYHYLQPDVVVDISSYWENKMESILAYGTQFYNPDSKEPKTLISSEKFLKQVEARAREMGAKIGCEFGEGFTTKTTVAYDFLNIL